MSVALKKLFVWVVNSARENNQSAAQGCMIRAAYDIKKNFPDTSHVFLVTNELPHPLRSLHKTDPALVAQVMSYWADRFCVALPLSDIYSSIVALGGGRERPLKAANRSPRCTDHHHVTHGQNLPQAE